MSPSTFDESKQVEMTLIRIGYGCKMNQVVQSFGNNTLMMNVFHNLYKVRITQFTVHKYKVSYVHSSTVSRCTSGIWL